MSQSPEVRSRTPITQVVVPLLVVIVSSLFAYRIADLNIQTARRQQTEEFESRRLDEARAKRGDIYQRFLESANRFAVAALKAETECPRICPSPPGEFQTARFEFQGSLNEVYIHGSAEALDKSRAVAATLPPSLGSLTGEVTITRVDGSLFTNAYREFLSILCREIPAKPRTEC